MNDGYEVFVGGLVLLGLLALAVLAGASCEARLVSRPHTCRAVCASMNAHAVSTDPCVCNNRRVFVDGDWFSTDVVGE